MAKEGVYVVVLFTHLEERDLHPSVSVHLLQRPPQGHHDGEAQQDARLAGRLGALKDGRKSDVELLETRTDLCSKIAALRKTGKKSSYILRDPS